MPSLRSKAGASARRRPLRRPAVRRVPNFDVSGRLRRTSPRTRLIAGVLVVALVGGIAWWRRPPDPRAGSVPVPGRAEELGIARIPDAYELTYRIEDHAGGRLLVSTDKLWVRRPFTGRLDAWEGAPPGSKRLSEQLYDLGRLTTKGAGQATTLGAPPALAGSDVRPDIVLPAALERDWVQRREQREVYGRRCQVYRAGGPVNAGDLTPYTPESEDYADFCVDAAGLVVEDVWYTLGRLVRRRVAVAVEEAPRLSRSLFRMDEGTRIPAREGGGSVRRLTVGSRPPGTFWELASPPEGFELEGRYAVVPPQTAQQDPMEPDRRIASVMDVWVRGGDMILVDRGGSITAVSNPLGTHPWVSKADLGELGEGELILSLRGNEVRLQRSDGSFVRLVGTVQPDVLIALAQSMHPAEGGELVCLDDDGAEVPCVTPAPEPTPFPEGFLSDRDDHDND